MRTRALAALHVGEGRVIPAGALVPEGTLSETEERSLLRLGFLERVDATEAPPAAAAPPAPPAPPVVSTVAPAPAPPAPPAPTTAPPPPPPPAAPAADRMATIMEALDLLEPEHFDADGVPKLADLSEVVGFSVTADEAKAAKAAKDATE